MVNNNNWLLSSRFFVLVLGLAHFNSYSSPANDVSRDNIAAKILQYSQINDTNAVLTSTGAADLNIIKGKRPGDITLFSKVNRTKTVLGSETLKHLLINPINDRVKLANRQSFVRKLKGDVELLRNIDLSIDKIRCNEENLFKFWADSHKLESDILGLSTQLVGADNSKVLTELTRAAAFAGIGVIGAFGAIGSFVGLCTLGGFFAGIFQGQRYNHSGDLIMQFDKYDAVGLGFFLGLAGLTKYRLIPAFRNQSKVSSQMHELLTSVSSILSASKELNAQLETMGEATKALSYIKNLKIYTESFEGLTTELKSLIKELQTKTFVDNKSRIKFAGRIRVTYKKFNELKGSFENLFRAIGEVDAYASFARLMNEHDDQATRFCFVDYVGSKTPVIEFQDSWCATIERDIIVTQTLNLGNKELHSEVNEPYYPNVYLTAANGAGKSTLLILTAHNTIMSQVVGIATGTSWRTTLFDYIATHANIDHNTQNGQSSYAVEQEVMDKLKVGIMKKFNNKKVVLAIIDEPFKSTAAVLGSKVLTEFIEEIEFYDKSICLIASHLLEPAVKIEKENKGRFINLCIPTNETKPGSGVFVRDHKIVAGIDKWLQGDENDPDRTLRYDNWLRYTKLDARA